MRDLTNEVTCFLISAGKDPNYIKTLNALNKQTCKFKLDIIKDYTPMSRAFQEMLNRVTTPYYIEVDSDMVLNNNAVEEMYDNIIKERTFNDKVVMLLRMLYDPHLEMNIYGIKIYHADTFKKYPYNLEHPSCEVEQLDRMKEDGYTYISIDEGTVGKHSPKWNNYTIFERYRNLVEKYKIYKYNWMGRLPEFLINKIIKEPTEQNIYALAGALSGVYNESKMQEEKDMSTKHKDLMKLETYRKYNPSQATIYLNDKCNFKCSWCLRQHGYIEEAPDFTAEMVNKLLTKLPSINGVCICGYGETFMSPKLPEVIKALKQKNKTVGVITNGSLLVDKYDEYIGSKIRKPDYISVSLNASCAEVHKEVTKTDMFNKVIEGIKYIVSKNHMPIYLSYVCTRKNLDDAKKFMKLAKELKVKGVFLHNVLPHFDEMQNETFLEYCLTNDNKSDIIELMNDENADIVEKFPTLVDFSRKRCHCVFPFNMLGVDGNGSYTICNSVYPTSSKNGNIDDLDLLHNDYCDEFRETFYNGQLKEACKLCFRNGEIT